MEAAEAVIRAGMLQAGGGMLEKLLAADPGYRGPRVACGQGHEAEFTACRDKVIDTVLGPVTLTRAWYHCAACGHGFAPRDAELGVAGASLSPGLAAMTDRAAAAGPFAKAAGLLEDLAGVQLTAKRVERAAEASGAARAAAVRDRAALFTTRKLVPLPPSPLPDKLYAVIDGTGVPVTATETAGRDGKGKDGRARTREVKLAVFFTQDKLDDKGYPVRDRDSSSYIATFEPAATFAGLVEAEGIRRGAGHVRQLTILGDGAPWIWNIASSKFPEATQIVDLYHAREHLHDLARSLEFMLGDQKDAWLAARLEDLDDGDIDGICTAARVYPLVGVKKEELDTDLGYFENNAPRMRYHWFRSRGLFVGSGVVEAGCKAVIGQRRNCPACTGPSSAQTLSPRSAASRPADPKTRSGTQHATRHQPPDQPNPLNDLGHLQNRVRPGGRAVERGETVVVTRDGVHVGRLVPERRTSAGRLKAALREHPAGAGFADDFVTAHADPRQRIASCLPPMPGLGLISSLACVPSIP
jgi:antitoxin (DNA-binding transcriptional repressor) of toxin-antitoxin stability system